MKKLLTAVSVATILLSTSAMANTFYDDYHNFTDVDEFTDESTYTSIKRSEYAHFQYGQGEMVTASHGLRCNVSETGQKSLLLKFDTGRVFASQGSSVTIFYKIDNNKAIKINGSMFSNSYESGYARVNHQVINEMKKGNNVKIRVSTSRDSQTMEFSLAGYTKSTNQVLNKCK